MKLREIYMISGIITDIVLVIAIITCLAILVSALLSSPEATQYTRPLIEEYMVRNATVGGIA